MKKLLLIISIFCACNAQAFEKIRYVGMTKHINVSAEGIPSGYIELQMLFRVQLPEALAQQPNIAPIAETYKSMFNIDRIDTIDNVLYGVFTPQPFSINIYKQVNGVTTTDLVTDSDIKTIVQNEYNIYTARLSQFQLFPFDAIIGKSLIGSTWQDSE